MVHEVKILAEYADAVYSGKKTFEVRKNDRNYQVGDILKFKAVRKIGQEYKNIVHAINGRTYEITYVLKDYGLKENCVVLAIVPAAKEAARAAVEQDRSKPHSENNPFRHDMNYYSELMKNIIGKQM